MISWREKLDKEIASLKEPDLKKLQEFIEFLKLHPSSFSTSERDENELAALYSEFADEDRELAEEDIEDYNAALTREDV